MSAPAQSEQLVGRTEAGSESKAEPSIRAIAPEIGGRAQPADRPSGQAPAGDVAKAPEVTGRLSYNDWLKQELGAVIDQLELSELQKRCLRARWLDAVMWTEGKAKQAQRAYYALRLLIIVGGVIIPALVSLDLGSDRAAGLVRAATFGLSLLVAISAAIEGFFHYGERWRHYRSIAERLKIEGWQLFRLKRPLRPAWRSRRGLHRVRRPGREVIQSDVQQYITEIVREKQAPAGQSGTPPETAQPAPSG